MERNKVVLGIDVGGTNTNFGLIKEDGEDILFESIPTNSHEPAKKTLC